MEAGFFGAQSDGVELLRAPRYEVPMSDNISRALRSSRIG